VNTIPTIIPVVSFLAYLLLKREPLSAAQAFTALSLFNILRFPLFQLPQIVTQVRRNKVPWDTLFTVQGVWVLGATDRRTFQPAVHSPTK
jgi:hypothetical protein